jgi:phosphoribosyl 1,2-cyclic phosphate phosphodiesterase
LKITFLGTGTSQGVPVISCQCAVCHSTDKKDNRLRSSVLIEHKNITLVIDSGPDFRQQMLRARVMKLDGLIFTHEHKDHIAGMDDIRAFNYTSKKKVDVYATNRVQEALKREFPYVFADFKYPGVPEINVHTINDEPFKVGNVDVIPIQVLHYRLPVLGFRIGDFTYITDANYISEKEKEKIKGSKVLVLNALRKEPHVSHYTMDQAVSLIKELGVDKGYLTHISHQLGKHEIINNELPESISCAFDGLTLNL